MQECLPSVWEHSLLLSLLTLLHSIFSPLDPSAQALDILTVPQCVFACPDAFFPSFSWIFSITLFQFSCPVSSGTQAALHYLVHPQPHTLYFQFQQIHCILFYRFFCPSRTAAFKSHLRRWLPRMCVYVCECVSMCGSAITAGHLDPMPGCLHQRGPYPGPPPCTKCPFWFRSLKNHRPQVSTSWGSLSDFRVEPWASPSRP